MTVCAGLSPIKEPIPEISPEVPEEKSDSFCCSLKKETYMQKPIRRAAAIMLMKSLLLQSTTAETRYNETRPQAADALKRAAAAVSAAETMGTSVCMYTLYALPLLHDIWYNTCSFSCGRVCWL